MGRSNRGIGAYRRPVTAIDPISPHLSGQLGATRTQGDLFTAQLAGDVHRFAAGRQGAGDILERLCQRELALRRFPGPSTLAGT